MESELPNQNRTGSVVGGRYQLRRQIGRGGMGTVYEATDTHGQPWAIKLLEPFVGPNGVESARRFAREIRALESVSSPHVLAIVDADTESEQPWLVTELLAGSDLETLLREVGHLAPDVAVGIAVQIARGLAAVHARGFLHRDVKPSNVFLHVGEDGSVVAKLLDFGIAKALFADESLTDSGFSLGTPLYMSPEQFLDAKRVDARSDVYSLGMTLYRALAGVTAFDGSTSLKDLALRVTTEVPTPIQRHAPWLAPGLARIVHGAILRDRDARCPSMEALLGHLQQFAKLALEKADLKAPRPEIQATPANVALLPARWAEVERDRVERESHSSSGSIAADYVGTTLGGRYHLSKLIGSGGMGAVFEAEGPDNTKVAVKIVTGLSTHRSEVARRLIREGRTAMKLKGAHVVHVLEVDMDRETGMPFVVMELLRGVNLAETIRELGPLAPEVAARIFVQVCEGLAEAHQLGIVHRDVKPTNLFLHRREDGTFVAKLCDFGLVKEHAGDHETTDLTQTGGILGTPAYMSPEQFDNPKNVDARSDIWSTGAALFEALTGQRVWGDRKTILEVASSMSKHEPPAVQQVAPWIDAAFARVVERALKKEPTNRIGTAKELANALVLFTGTVEQLNATMLVPLPPERKAKLGRPLAQPITPGIWTKRWPMVLVAIGLILSATVTGIVVNSREKEMPPAPVTGPTLNDVQTPTAMDTTVSLRAAPAISSSAVNVALTNSAGSAEIPNSAPLPSTSVRSSKRLLPPLEVHTSAAQPSKFVRVHVDNTPLSATTGSIAPTALPKTSSQAIPASTPRTAGTTRNF